MPIFKQPSDYRLIARLKSAREGRIEVVETLYFNSTRRIFQIVTEHENAFSAPNPNFFEHEVAEEDARRLVAGNEEWLAELERALRA